MKVAVLGKTPVPTSSHPCNDSPSGTLSPITVPRVQSSKVRVQSDDCFLCPGECYEVSMRARKHSGNSIWKLLTYLTSWGKVLFKNLMWNL